MCSLCRRNLLAGEQYRRWEPEPGRGGRPVCNLCESEATKAGWSRAASGPEREGALGVGSRVRLVA